MNMRLLGSLGSDRRLSPCLAICFASLLPLGAQAQNVVSQWNDIAITQARASTEPGATSAGATSLYVAYVQLAVYNSVVAIEDRFRPYEYSVPAPRDASPDAA